MSLLFTIQIVTQCVLLVPNVSNSHLKDSNISSYKRIAMKITFSLNGWIQQIHQKVYCPCVCPKAVWKLTTSPNMDSNTTFLVSIYNIFVVCSSQSIYNAYWNDGISAILSWKICKHASCLTIYHLLLALAPWIVLVVIECVT